MSTIFCSKEFTPDRVERRSVSDIVPAVADPAPTKRDTPGAHGAPLGADEIRKTKAILGWPDEAFAQAGIDSATAVAVLTHDPKFDDPALMIALRSPAMYVGAIGSKKTQAARRERLRASGLTDDQLGRLFGPIGLDLGGRTPAETALAIMAEIVAVRHGAAVARTAG